MRKFKVAEGTEMVGSGRNVSTTVPRNCPDCGEKPHQAGVPGSYFWRVYCDNKDCPKQMSTQWWPRELAVYLWNTGDVISKWKVWALV
jgi:hypothetical protein